MDRRSFLKLVALSAAGGLQPVRSLSAQVVERRKRLLQLNAYALDAETPLDLLTSYITPNDPFFIRSHYLPSRLDSSRWRLTIDGEVARPMRLTLNDLQKLPATETTCVLQCAGNGRAALTPAT